MSRALKVAGVSAASADTSSVAQLEAAPVSKTQSFAVYAHEGKRGPKFMAYTLWYNEAWPGFVGNFIGMGTSRLDRMRDAINQARARVTAAGRKP